MIKHYLTQGGTKPRLFFGYFLLREKKVTSTGLAYTHKPIPNEELIANLPKEIASFLAMACGGIV
jgi:hypothetical protein